MDFMNYYCLQEYLRIPEPGEETVQNSEREQSPEMLHRDREWAVSLPVSGDTSNFVGLTLSASVTLLSSSPAS